MSRDYAKKSRAPARRTPSPRSGGTPPWLLFVAGMVVGGFLASLYFIKNPVTQAPPPEEPKPKVQDNKTPKPRFDFYKLLQESETIVPASETMNAESSAPSNQEKMEYILQVGSFPKAEDADKLRAQLIMLNLDARIEKVEIRKGEIWHRVVVGPFNTQAELASARSQLVNNQYNALVLKRAKSK